MVGKLIKVKGDRYDDDYTEFTGKILSVTEETCDCCKPPQVQFWFTVREEVTGKVYTVPSWQEVEIVDRK